MIFHRMLHIIAVFFYVTNLLAQFDQAILEKLHHRSEELSVLFSSFDWEAKKYQQEQEEADFIPLERLVFYGFKHGLMEQDLINIVNEFKATLKSLCSDKTPICDWDKFVIKNHHLTDTYKTNQEVYGSILKTTADIAKRYMDQKASYEFIEAIASFGRFVAAFNGSGHGYKRVEKACTKLNSAYQIVADYWQQLLADFGATDKSKPMAVILIHKDYLVCGYDSVAMFICQDNELKKAILARILLNVGEPSADSAFMHTSYEDLKKINHGTEKLQKLFNQALAVDGKEQLKENLAEFFWWYCMIKPLNFGDPSVAEIIIKAVLLHKGYEVPGWKEGVIPWVKVVTQFNVDIFKNEFWHFAEYQE